MDKIPDMGDRRHLTNRRSSNIANSRSYKIVEAAPEGDGRWETGSANTAISEEVQNQQDRPLVREEEMALDYSNHTSDGPALDVLSNTPSKPNDGAGGGSGLGSEERDDNGSNRTKAQLSNHPDVDCAQAVGYAGQLSSPQQVHQ